MFCSYIDDLLLASGANQSIVLLPQTLATVQIVCMAKLASSQMDQTLGAFIRMPFRTRASPMQNPLLKPWLMTMNHLLIWKTPRLGGELQGLILFTFLITTQRLPPPSVCEVSNPDDQDPLVNYHGLVPLR